MDELEENQAQYCRLLQEWWKSPAVFLRWIADVTVYARYCSTKTWEVGSSCMLFFTTC